MNVRKARVAGHALPSPTIDRDLGTTRTDPPTMQRRVLLLIAVVGLALLATAVAPWTLTGGGVAATVAAHLREDYGLNLQVRGRSTIAALPVPRVKFEDVQVSSPDGRLAVEGGTFRGELRLLPLLVGRVELSDVSLSGSRVTLAGDWLTWFRSVSLPRPETILRRLIVTGSSVRWPDGGIEDLNVVVNRSGKTGVEIAGSLAWRGERVEIAQASFDPPNLLTGEPSPFSLSLVAPASRISAAGEVQTGADPRVTGTSRLEIRSPWQFSRWTGVELPLGSVIPSIAIEGDFSADRRRVSWPSVVVTLGADRLDGTLGLRFNDGRPGLTGTLAADRLNLSELFAPFLQARTGGGWSGESVSLDRVTGGDLDLRLSAADATLGRLKLAEMAAGILVQRGRVEASLSRAGLYNGTLKGRLTLVQTRGGVDVKAQGALDRVNVGPLLSGFGSSRWMTGLANGQFQLEGGGPTVADIVRRAGGRTALKVRDGELVGIGLNDLVKRVEKRPLAASLEWRGGRTPFELAQLSLAVAGGVGEVAEGWVASQAVRTSLHGQISLIDSAVALRADVVPTANPYPEPLIVFAVTGGFGDIAVIPDAKALIERSGAAKSLLGERLAPAPRGASAPMATAQ
jgi:AsmA protein